jgi:hypothetical protein
MYRRAGNISTLGIEFQKAAEAYLSDTDSDWANQSVLCQAMQMAAMQNPWFIPVFVRFAFSAWAKALQEEKISHWLTKYHKPESHGKQPMNVGIIMAGNIPLVGLHDLLCIYLSGHNATIRLSSQDKVLIPTIIEVLTAIDPAVNERFQIVEGPLKNFDAIIATGSNNASRYFEYYFGKYPGIIRKNRNGIAVITGNETDEELKALADDIFMYFGLGCRNVSKLYLPEGYMVEKLFPFFSGYSCFADLHKYRNNYDYQKSILLINRAHHLDNGFLLVKEDHSLISPVSVLHTGTYTSIESLKKELGVIKDKIQCIVSGNNTFDNAVPFGKSQVPELWEYADGVDTLEFLLNL